MGLLRKALSLSSSEQENLEHSKKLQPVLAPWEVEELRLFNSNTSGPKWDASQYKAAQRMETYDSLPEEIREAIAEFPASGFKDFLDDYLIEFGTTNKQFLAKINSSVSKLPFPDKDFFTDVENMNTYYGDDKGVDSMANFDPFLYNPIAKLKLNALIVNKSMMSLPRYVPSDADMKSVLDPLSIALFFDIEDFANDLIRYLDPYMGSVTMDRDKNAFTGTTYNFVLKLGLPNGKPSLDGKTMRVNLLDSKSVTCEEAYKFQTIDEVLYLFDGMIENYEELFPSNKKVRTLEETILKEGTLNAATNMDDKISKAYAMMHMSYDEETGEIKQKMRQNIRNAKLAPLKVKEILLCPDHNNPMMRKKGDEERLHCTVIGCKRVLRRKKPGTNNAYVSIDAPKPPELPPPPALRSSAFAEPIADVVFGLDEAFKNSFTGLISAPPANVIVSSNNPQAIPGLRGGWLSNDLYLAVNTPVRLHQDIGHTYLVQTNPDGTESRICITQHVQNIDYRQDHINVGTPLDPYATVPGMTDVTLIMGGFQIE